MRRLRHWRRRGRRVFWGRHAWRSLRLSPATIPAGRHRAAKRSGTARFRKFGLGLVILTHRLPVALIDCGRPRDQNG
ncbi:hypothetical protein AA103581_0164 [Gluconobacter wancherniae NBRC 103581]|nr:hypothetical protein AA103581_0164 [Gluconobacter wancherniae NBRC 103581]